MNASTDTIEHIPLKTEFDKKGFHYSQIWRDDKYAIYKQTRNGRELYEVIRITRHNGRTVMGTPYPPAEIYPKAQQWGMLGWSCPTQDYAWWKLEEIRERFDKGDLDETAATETEPESSEEE